MKKKLVFYLLILSHPIICQTFYFGNDLSYVNQMEDCGTVFKEGMQPKDVYQIFSDHGSDLVRVRLWVDPSWQNPLVQPEGVKNQYSDFEDVKETIMRSKAAGMQVMLGFQLSDIWADPGRQLIPARWLSVATNLPALKDSVYNYVTDVLMDLEKESLMPEFVKIGNENNSGILKHTILYDDYSAGGSVSSDWSRHAQLYNSAIKAVRDVSKNTAIKPKIALHFAGLSGLSWWYQNIINNGVTDFDIIGFSYYYAWHGSSIKGLGEQIKELKIAFPGYEVMAVEMGYLWTTQNFDQLENIITTPDPAYLPVIPEKQLEYLVDYTREVMKAGGSGVIFWEPAWVSTPCRTPWGQGSSHDHVVFFDPVNTNFMENGGGKWPEERFYQDLEANKVTFKVDMEGYDISNGVYITGAFTGEPWDILPMANEGNNIYSYFTYLPEGDSGAFYFLNDSSWEARETVPSECAAWWNTDRGYKAGQNDTVFFFKWGSCSNGGSASSVNVTFKVNMRGQDLSRGVYITGHVTGWGIIKMTKEGNSIYNWTGILTPGDTMAYYYLTTSTWNNYLDYREDVPSECSLMYGSDRRIIVPGHDTIVFVGWGSCDTSSSSTSEIKRNIWRNTDNNDVDIFFSPGDNNLYVNFSFLVENLFFEIIDLSGRPIVRYKDASFTKEAVLNTKDIHSGIYLLKIFYDNRIIYKKVFLN